MRDSGTIIGIIGLLSQVLGSVDEVIAIFEKLRNAPYELRRFRVNIRRLAREYEQYDQLKGLDSGPAATRISDDNDQHIREVLIECQNVLNVTYNKRTSWMGWATFSLDSRKLSYLNNEINSIYIQILGHALNKSLQYRDDPFGIPQGGSVFNDAANSPDSDSYANPRESFAIPTYREQELDIISKLIGQLRIIQDNEQFEFILHDIQARLQQCSYGKTADDSGSGKNDNKPQLGFETIPTTLHLDNAAPQHKVLKFDQVRLMDSDEDIGYRILEYRNTETHVRLTHIVYFGTIPSSPSDELHKATFEYPQIITICDEQHTYQVYHRIFPVYEFDKVALCEEFQSLLRQRRLYGAYQALNVYLSGTLLAEWQMIRLWYQHKPGQIPVVTLSFLKNFTDPGKHHCEVNLADLQPDAVYRRRKLSLSGTTYHVDLYVCETPRCVYQLRFGSESEAKEFKSCFEHLRRSYSGFSSPVSKQASYKPVFNSQLQELRIPRREIHRAQDNAAELKEIGFSPTDISPTGPPSLSQTLTTPGSATTFPTPQYDQRNHVMNPYDGLSIGEPQMPYQKGGARIAPQASQSIEAINPYSGFSIGEPQLPYPKRSVHHTPPSAYQRAQADGVYGQGRVVM